MNPDSSTTILSDREFTIEHRIHAPAAKVFAAYTDPRLIPRWWANPGATMTIDKLDVRPGGRWRFVQHLADGQRMAFSGEFVEVKPVTRLAYTFQVEGQPHSQVTATVDLVERHGITHITLTNLCLSKEVRDGMLQYGAAAGAKASWKRLEEVVNAEGDDE